MMVEKLRPYFLLFNLSSNGNDKYINIIFGFLTLVATVEKDQLTLFAYY